MKKILIVDDNEKNRKLLRVILSKSGYEVHEAENGDEGVVTARTIHPDLVLMDFRMPVMDGIEATKAMKADAALGQVPVFIVTSSAMDGDLERITAASGCDALYTKPIDYQMILGKIKEKIGV